MTIIKLLKPFEKTLENRRFKIILYLLTSIILAPVAAYLEYIGLRPVHIIWCIWLLIIPVTYFIYLVCSSVTKSFLRKEKVSVITVKVCYASDGKPASGKRITLGFPGLMRGMIGPEFTDSSGKAHFYTDSGFGDVYVDGKSVYKGRLDGQITAFF